jgi:3-hydroxybutyryl-CoA dehydratase
MYFVSGFDGQVIDWNETMILGKTIDQLKVGDSAQFAKTVAESDIYLFAGITGDLNPAHINEAYAKTTYFKGRIAHGMLSAGFISAVLGTILPGPGTVYLHQELNFLAPVRIGDTITARVEVVKKLVKKQSPNAHLLHEPGWQNGCRRRCLGNCTQGIDY